LAEPADHIRFENHHFEPAKLSVAAGRPLTLKVTNASNETIEFESFKLNREQALSPGETITVRLPALSAGSYDFYDDFHQDVPEGTLVAQ
jgi:plastocyanin